MLQATPDVGSAAVRDFVRGVITANSAIVTFLALDRVIPHEENVLAA